MKKIFIPILMSIVIFTIFIPITTTLTTYLHPVVLVVLFFCLLVVNLAIYLFVTKQQVLIRKSLLIVAFILYTLSLLVLLFMRPSEPAYDNSNLVPLKTISMYLSGNADWFVSFYNLAANVGLFVPFGVLLAFLTRNILIRAFLPFALISCIEITQLLTNRGSLDIDDLILNVLGFYIGYALVPIVRKIVKIK
ncbi:VanZ family protein [Sutcliffiella horikoshii]|uniref:VanZ family protein n=1 Tax=Sutcliffiella horikoshii TaxID=79883 RepID=A0AA94WQB2_9BACI|nr:VanZ family protein [Sutcliffiella horikoshii]TYS59741.1 VanZ family protein [Sutcliffiella horikoshii]